MSAFWSTVAGVVFGAIVSAAISYIFARSASKELREEAEDLRRETREVLRYVDSLIFFLEEAGQIAVTRDAQGRPTKVQFLYGGSASAITSVGGGEITVT